MSNKQIRTFVRYFHIVVGVMIFIYVYSPTLASNQLYAGLIQFVVIPLVGMTGIALWQQPRLLKLLRRTA